MKRSSLKKKKMPVLRITAKNFTQAFFGYVGGGIFLTSHANLGPLSFTHSVHYERPLFMCEFRRSLKASYA